MDYQAAHDAFFHVADEGSSVPDVVSGATAARRLRDAAEPVAMHAVWSRRVNEALAERGLNFLSSYVYGRAASLGEPSAEVAAAAFAWFEPGLVRALYDEGRGLLARDELLRIRTAVAIDGLQEILASEDVAEVAETADTLRRALESLEAVGRPLFAGLRALPGPVEPVGQLWRACDLVREYRGDGHIAAVASTGLTPVQMNILTELWLGMPLLSPTPRPAPGRRSRWVTPSRLFDASAGSTGRSSPNRERQAAGRSRTGRMRRSTLSSSRWARQIDALAYRLDGWGQLCIDADAFPPDPFKRWAG